MAKSKYLVHSTDNCPYCKQAKGLLDHYELEYEVVLGKSNEWPTYPCVYRIGPDGEIHLIGGFNELADFSFANDIRNI